MIGYFNFKRINNKVLITNDYGENMILDNETFFRLVKEQVVPQDPAYNDLQKKGFIIDKHWMVHTDKAANMFIKYNNYLFYPTSLHIFVITNMCNMRCVYCQARSEENESFGRMTEEVAKKAVDIALQTPAKYLTFEFQGGEPLLNYDIVKYIVEYTERVRNDKVINYSIVTNTTLLTQDICKFLSKHRFGVSVSLDGDEMVNDCNRIMLTGESSYKYISEKIRMLRENGIEPCAIQTTTKHSLHSIKEIVDTYCSLELNSIFIRALTPLGFASNHWDTIGYSAEEFVDFYNGVLDYVIQVNHSGKPLKETQTTLFLEKILKTKSGNYMELRSPCGATYGQIAYYYTGDIFTCDEGRMLYQMGEDAFKIGSVFDDSYQSIVCSKKCQAIAKSTVLQTLPGCCDCAYMPYCGVCPVVNYALENDLMTRTYRNYRCKIYMGILDSIFKHLQIREDKELFMKWIEE